MQKGVGDKTVSQLEKTINSKLEATVARQIQAQFQTSGKQALQVSINVSCQFDSMSLKALSHICIGGFQRL